LFFVTLGSFGFIFCRFVTRTGGRSGRGRGTAI
jgi:hypothetical protein